MQRNIARSGFVMLLGRPSSGKSTLVNALCGHKVSIVSSTPQTTRNTIRGIVNDPRGQIILLDTPGFHNSEKKLNRRLRDVVEEHLAEADLLLYLVDSTRQPGDEERMIAEIVGSRPTPAVVAITKTDSPLSKPDAAEAFLNTVALGAPPVVRLGNLTHDAPSFTGVDTLLDRIIERLPEGEPWYPDDYYTDQQPAFRIAEIIREQAIRRAREELPHALFVEIADLEQNEKRIWARAFILVERSSQQGIVVGKKGATITAIRRDAERELSQLFPVPVRLSVQVKVRPKWRRDDQTLQSLIY